MAERAGLQPQTLNIADATRGQVEQVLRLVGLQAGNLSTMVYSLKPAVPFREVIAEQDQILMVMQGVGTAEIRSQSGESTVLRLRRGAHFSVARGAGFRLSNTGRALLIVVQAAC